MAHLQLLKTVATVDIIATCTFHTELIACSHTRENTGRRYSSAGKEYTTCVSREAVTGPQFSGMITSVLYTTIKASTSYVVLSSL